jgi:preprotein translocase subunit SecG
VLTDILVALDCLVALALVVLVLLHSGRGGGLSDMFGASSGSAATG